MVGSGLIAGKIRQARGNVGTLLRVVTLFGALLPTVANAQLRTGPFYAIVHMTNTVEAVRWAMTEGANGVEMDLRFTSSGEPDSFRHGGGIICDCLCSIFTTHNVCSHVTGCDATTPVRDMLSTLAAQTGLALVVLDTKLTGADADDVQAKAGLRIVQTLDVDLFGKGYGGKVVISVAHPDAMTYLVSAARQASVSPSGDRIFFTFDQEGGSSTDAARTIKALGGLHSKNIVYGTGATACLPGNFEDAIATAALNERAGVVGLVYVWTLDKQKSMKRYIEKGARGILTNSPRALLAVIRELNLSLAVPGSPIHPASSTDVFGAKEYPATHGSVSGRRPRRS